MHNRYYEQDKLSRGVAAGRHREIIGGLWEEVGALQLEFLKSRGMKPAHKLLDIGCGSLRLGVGAIAYLEPGHYYGTDLRRELMDAGYEKELTPLGLEAKLPRENLVEDASFDFPGIPEDIDFAIAQSVFTHLPLNYMRRCIANIRRFPRLKEFCFTVFLVPSAEDLAADATQWDGIVTHDCSDPFHVLAQDIAYFAGQYGLRSEVFDWNHPRNQQMVVVTYS